MASATRSDSISPEQLDQMKKYWAGLSAKRRLSLVKVPKQEVSQRLWASYCSRCRGLLCRVSSDLMSQKYTLHAGYRESGANPMNQVAKDSAGGKSTGDEAFYITVEHSDFVVPKDLVDDGEKLFHFFELAENKERERFLAHPEACDGDAPLYRAVKDSCGIHSRTPCFTQVLNFWLELKLSERKAFMKMSEDSFLSQLTKKFNSDQHCKSCRKSVLTEFKKSKHTNSESQEEPIWMPCRNDKSILVKFIMPGTFCMNWKESFDHVPNVVKTQIQIEYDADEPRDLALCSPLCQSDSGHASPPASSRQQRPVVGTPGKVIRTITLSENQCPSRELTEKDTMILEYDAVYRVTFKGWHEDGTVTEVIGVTSPADAVNHIFDVLSTKESVVTLASKWLEKENIVTLFERCMEREDLFRVTAGTAGTEEETSERRGTPTPDTARLYLVDFAAATFKRRLEEGFLHTVAQANAMSHFRYIAMSLIRKQILSSSKEATALELQALLLEDEEKQNQKKSKKKKRKDREREKAAAAAALQKEHDESKADDSTRTNSQSPREDSSKHSQEPEPQSQQHSRHDSSSSSPQSQSPHSQSPQSHSPSQPVHRLPAQQGNACSHPFIEGATCATCAAANEGNRSEEPSVQGGSECGSTSTSSKGRKKKDRERERRERERREKERLEKEKVENERARERDTSRTDASSANNEHVPSKKSEGGKAHNVSDPAPDEDEEIELFRRRLQINAAPPRQKLQLPASVLEGFSKRIEIMNKGAKKGRS